MPSENTPSHRTGQPEKPQTCESTLLRRLVRDRASELFADGDRREISSVIAREFRISEARVDRILAGLMLEHQRRADCLSVAVRNGVSMALEAGAAVWRDGWGQVTRRPAGRAGAQRAEVA